MDFRSLRTRFQLPDTMERMDGKESLKTILNLLMERTLNTLMTKTIIRALGGTALILTLITGIWFVDDRYVNAKDLNNLKEQINLRIDTYEYRELTKQYYELKKLIRENPDSEELKEQLKEVETERKILRERIDAKLE